MNDDTDLLLIMVATHSERMMPQYLEQLAAANIPVHIERFTEYPNCRGGGTLGFTVDTKRRLAQQFHHYDNLIFTCAFDVLLFRSKAEILPLIPQDHVVMGAEKNCYPDASIAPRVPDRGPWRFSNGGPYAGTPANFIKWADDMQRHPRYNPNMLDQELYNIMLAEGDARCWIDWRTELFFCMYGEAEDLSFRHGKPINKFHGTHPAFLHFNGQWPWLGTYAHARWQLSLTSEEASA